MLELIQSVNSAVNNFIWGVPAMICIIGVGLLLTIKTKFLQIRKFPYAMKETLGRVFKKQDASDGSMTPFQAVCTALASTVGTGNIAGVAGAIAIGGVFVGGVAASGGYGSVVGTLVGIFVIMLLKTGLPYVGLQANWQQIITGVVLIVAVLIDILKEKKSAH